MTSVLRRLKNAAHYAANHDLLNAAHDELSLLSADIDEYQQQQDEIIVALGSAGLLPSEIVDAIKRLSAENKRLEEWANRMVISLDWYEENVHPDYGPCDAIADGHCTECERVFAENSRLESDVLHWKGMTKGRESEIDKHLAKIEIDRITMDNFLGQLKQKDAENSRLKGVLAELESALGLDAPVSTEQKRSQDGNDDRGSDQYANPEHCRHLGDTWTAGGQTYCDECGVELL